eukprot:m.56560 g.56560  ORF g.56560 m.56560 type:complete len:375 (+) comp13022_c0_seq2:85-1209(+)
MEKMSSDMERVLNFSAGPARLPLPVLMQAQQEMLSCRGSGMSVMEMSHRGKDFQVIIDEAEADLRTLMSIPDNYKVLFMQGGGTGQFAAIPLNLAPDADAVADYIVTGGWSAKAEEEGRKYCRTHVINPLIHKHTDIAEYSTFKFSENASFVYYCDNETVYGVEFPNVPTVPEGTVLVCDMSSNFLTRAVDVSKFGLIYAGAQKNAGPAGLTIVIVREDLLGHAQKICPTVLDYKTMADHGSMPHTPPCWSIYVTGLVFKWVLAHGGLEEFEATANAKSSLIYSIIDSSEGFYLCPVAQRVRSRINVPFRVCKDGKPSEELEKKFLHEAEKNKLLALKGHRSVGGLRASLYNATTLEETRVLAEFMSKFQKENS